MGLWMLFFFTKAKFFQKILKYTYELIQQNRAKKSFSILPSGRRNLI